MRFLFLRSIIFAVTLALPKVGIAADSFATLSIIKTLGVQQTSARTVIDYKPSVSLQVSGLPAAYSVSGSQVTLGGYSLDMVSHRPGTVSFEYIKEFATNAAASSILPPGTYPLSAVSADASATANLNVVMVADFTAPLPQFANFDALQSWDGKDFILSWSPNPYSGISSTSVVAHVERADGTVIYSTSSPGLALSPSATSTQAISVSSTPGETLYATLFYSRLYGFTQAGSGPPGNATIFSISNSQMITVRMPIVRLAPPPVITAQPQSQTATIGANLTFSVGVTGEFVAYAWKKDGVTITGATNAALLLTGVQASDVGNYSVTVSNSGGAVTSSAAKLTIASTVVAPALATAPADLTIVAGAKATLTVTASGTAPFTYQWSRNGSAITGATSSTFTVESTLLADAGSYTVAITNSAGTVTSAAATLTVTPISRLSNLSVLSSLSNATDNFILGYVVGGANTGGNKPFVVRGVGPSLSVFGVGDPLVDPKIELFTGSTSVTENDNWAGLASLSTAFTGVGAFPFTSTASKDAAVLTSISTRDNSVKVSGTGAGSVLAEVYDASPDATFVSSTPRLVNVSVRKHLGDGLTVGFTIAGSAPKTVLIRAIGPTLGDFGVVGTVADPQLVLFNGSSVKIGENDNWGGTAALTTASTNVGAFALPATSKDAALLATLPPGSYSVQVSGISNTTGVALVEVYEVP